MKISEDSIGNVELKIKFSPEIVISCGEFELGRLTLEDMESFKIFLDNLHKSIKDLIVKTENEKKGVK